jgi:hypothetical protein
MFPRERDAPTQSEGSFGRSLRKLRARNHSSMRRRRAQILRIDRHHLSEESAR